MSEEIKEVYFVGSRDIHNNLMSHEVGPSVSRKDDANWDKIRVVDASPEYEGSSYRPDGSNALLWGVPVKAEFIPKSAIMKGRKRVLADFSKVRQMAFVSEKFRKVVESLEPGVHQFFPVKMNWGSGDPIEGQYYWFVVCNSVDGINAEHTEAPRKFGFKFVQQREAWGPWVFDKEGGGHYRIVFDLKSLKGYHIWQDKYMVTGPYCSGQFKQACEQAGITGIGFGYEPMEAV